jgi:hypothetical protein
MSLIKLYSIWHQTLFPELLQDLPAEDRQQYVCYAVNASIPKNPVHSSLSSFPILYEYKLPIYEPLWQEKGYCQTSCMMHLFLNDIPKKEGLDYVGFCQYDMRLYSNTIQHIKDTTDQTKDPILFYNFCHSVPTALNFQTGWNAILDHYNTYFQTSFTFEDILDKQMPLLHTFVMPTDMFYKMMKWMHTLLTQIEFHHMHISNVSNAEFAERIHGLFLVLEMVQQPTMKMMDMKIYHEWPLYHDQVVFKDYKAPPQTVQLVHNLPF